MNKETLKILYYANFESLWRFGIIFWGSNSNIKSIFVVRKKTISNICKTKKYEYINCLWFIYLWVSYVCNNYNTSTQDRVYPHRLTLTDKSTYYMCIKLYYNASSSIKCFDSLNRFKKIFKEMLIQLEPHSLEDYINSANLFFWICTVVLTYWYFYKLWKRQKLNPPWEVLLLFLLNFYALL